MIGIERALRGGGCAGVESRGNTYRTLPGVRRPTDADRDAPWLSCL